MKTTEITIAGRACHLTRLDATSNRSYSAHVLFDGKPIASIWHEDGRPNPDHLARADIALQSYLQSGGCWSYLGEGDEHPFADIDSSLQRIDGTCELVSYSHFVRHWSFERIHAGKYSRFLIWNKGLAESIFDRVRATACNVSLSGFDRGRRYDA